MANGPNRAPTSWTVVAFPMGAMWAQECAGLIMRAFVASMPRQFVAGLTSGTVKG